MNLLHNKTFIIGGSIFIGIGIIAGSTFLISSRTQNYNTVKVERKDITEKITATGKVEALDNVSLAFDKSGSVARVNVKIGDSVNAGDTLGALSSDELYASLEGAQADLKAEQEKLSQLQGSSGNTSTELVTAQHKLYDTVQGGLTTADDSVRNKVDQFFTDPDTMNPKILFAFNDYDLKEKINGERIVIEETLTKWHTMNTNLSSDSISNADAEQARTYLTTVKNFLDDVSRAVNNFEPNNTLPQSTIDKYKSDVASARANINTTLSNITSAEESLRGTSASGPVQETRVSKAQSAVDAIQSQINHTIIRAPFSGIVTKAEPKVGEFFAAGTPAFGIMTKDAFKVEIQIPEVDLAKIAVDNKAAITLDAYGTGNIFNAHVSAIDPSETVTNGVGTYKATLLFDKSDSKIYSGMTANAEVSTRTSNQALVVPSRAIIRRGNDTFVLVQNGKEYSEKKITTGIMNTNTETEVLSGLNEGDLIASFGNN
ncbi:MAG: efflux RND transporter periplasmic adaptor subunit [bacterium]